MNKNYKYLCQVFTPADIVNDMLDWCKYNKDLYGKKIVENSCGDGHILQEILKRYIKDCKKKNFEITQIKQGIENDIFGFEIDKEQYDKCISNLNLIALKNGIENINWNIQCKDSLKENIQEKYDYVIGNPPYIKYKSLDEKDRIFVKEKFYTCKRGKFDYCYAFIEKSIFSLKNNGKMAYLIPSSIFKNVFADELRKFLLPHIIEIYDYTTEKIFTKKSINEKDRLTSSSIIIIRKNSNTKEIKYYDIVNKKNIRIKKENLKEKWIFNSEDNLDNNMKKIRFGDYYKVSNTIATLYNKAFVIDKYNEEDDYIITNSGMKIEKEILRNTCSPRTLNKENKEKIIFPYYFERNRIKRYSDTEFKDKFPNAYEYLLENIQELKNRKSDANAKWFEYGRSQAIESVNNNKLLISTIITKKVNTKILPKNTIPYSGIYIQPIKDKTLTQAKNILEDNEFFEYVKKIGINASGESMRITSKDISNYRFNYWRN